VDLDARVLAAIDASGGGIFVNRRRHGDDGGLRLADSVRDEARGGAGRVPDGVGTPGVKVG